MVIPNQNGKLYLEDSTPLISTFKILFLVPLTMVGSIALYFLFQVIFCL